MTFKARRFDPEPDDEADAVNLGALVAVGEGPPPSAKGDLMPAVDKDGPGAPCMPGPIGCGAVLILPGGYR